MSQTYNSFLGMYQVFSSENWTDLLYLTMQAEVPFGQQWLAAVFFCVWILFAYGAFLPIRNPAHVVAIVLQMFIAVINEVSDSSRRLVSKSRRILPSPKSRSANDRLRSSSAGLNLRLPKSAG